MNEHAEVGARLREARDYVGLSQEFAAAKVGLGRSALSDIERGTRRVTGPELRRLAHLYGTTVDGLLGATMEETDETLVALTRTAGELTVEDRAEVLRFAQFLRVRARRAPE